DFSNGLGKRDGVAVVAHLLPGIDVLAWFAIARPEVAVVEYKYAQVASGEHFRELVEVHFLHRGKSMCHDDRRHLSCRSVGQIQPTAKRHAIFGLERNVPAHWCLLYDQANVRTVGVIIALAPSVLSPGSPATGLRRRAALSRTGGGLHVFDTILDGRALEDRAYPPLPDRTLHQQVRPPPSAGAP